MNRDIEVQESAMPKALFKLRYESKTQGHANITIYSSKMEEGMVITIPLLQYTMDFEHKDLDTLEQIRAFDEVFVRQELSRHSEQQQQWHLSYEHESIRSRCCILANGIIIGLAVLIDHFSDNHSTLHYLSAERMNDDLVLSGDRFSFLPVELLEKLSSFEQRALSFKPVL